VCDVNCHFLSVCSEEMSNDYDYSKEVSSNPADKAYLSFPDEENAWSPAGNDNTPTVTVIVKGGDAPQDTYIESVTIDSTDNVASVQVVVIKENGDRVCMLRSELSLADLIILCVGILFLGFRLLFKHDVGNIPERSIVLCVRER
jgi:hypothetical protein